MGKLQELRQQIRAIENIQAITRTLATVAAARLSRTRRRASGIRLYAAALREMLFHQQACLSSPGPGDPAGLLRVRDPIRRIAVLVITADRGMCGGYNLEACRLALKFQEDRRAAGQGVGLVLKGRRGAAYFRRRGAEILHEEGWPREGVVAADVDRLLGLLLDRYKSGEVDAVHAVYTEFYSPVRRRPRVVRVLPIEPEQGWGQPSRIEWSREPGLVGTVDELLAAYLQVQLWDVLLESYASEHGARMITMEEATERAARSLQAFRVQHHRLRREAITTDLLGALSASRAIEEEVAPRPA